MLRHEEVVFLDVEYLALRLASVLNHKAWEYDAVDGSPMFGGKRLEQQWQREASRHLIHMGVLHSCFADFLWERPGRPSPWATFDVLLKMGILLPLEEAVYWDAQERGATGDHLYGRTNAPGGRNDCWGRRFLVLMRLPKEPSPTIAQHHKAFEGLRKEWDLVSKW